MKKLFKKHIFYVVFALIAIIIALGGVTFAFFMSNTNQTTSNTMSSLDCVNVTFTAKTNSISLNNTYPMTDEEGAATSPYNFTIKNSCNSYVEYYLIASVISTTPQLSSSFVKVELDGDLNVAPITITSLNTYTTPESLSSYSILNNYKLGELSLTSNESQTFNFRMWLDGDQSATWTSEEINNTSYTVKLSVVGVVKDIKTHLRIKLPLNPVGNYSTTFTGASWNAKSSSLEVTNVLTSGINTINLTNVDLSSASNLANKIIGLSGTTSGNGQIVHETFDTTTTTKGAIYDSTYYTNTTNDATYPYSWNATNNTWTSTNHTNSRTSTITFKPNVSSYAEICYTISSEANYDKATFYVDGVSKGVVSGSSSSCISLGSLSNSNTIKVTYSKNFYNSSGNDNVIFSMYNDIVNTTTTDTGYRYEGKNPNNYISYNGELWRIIGVFNQSSHGIENTNLVKIIREKTAKTLVYDKNNLNDWPNSSLYTLLNDNYYHGINESTINNCYVLSNTLPGHCNFKLNGINSIPFRDMIQNVTWYLGGIDSNANAAGSFYNAERGTAVYTGRSTSVNANIGLMYMSDYLYSAPASSCARNTNLSVYNTDACAGKTWLYNAYFAWVIDGYTSNANYGWYVLYDGTGNLSSTSIGIGIIPVLYLKTDVVTYAGDGTKTNPYLITK